MMRTTYYRTIISVLAGITVALALLSSASLVAHGQTGYATSSTAEQLKSQIDDRTSKIRGLEKEIQKYQSELDDVGKQKTSLQNAIRTLDLSTQKIETQKNLSENKISQTELEISKLTLQIEDEEQKIELHSQTIAQGIREINQLDEHTFIESLLASSNISDFWSQVDNLEQFQQGLQTNLKELQGLKADLEVSLAEQEQNKQDLVNYTKDLANQARGLTITKQEKSDLLTKTKNKESNYQQLIADKKAEEAQFEQELQRLQSQLQFTLDPNSIPKAGTAIFSWPLDQVHVTQYFGMTAFAKTAAYNGRGHNGVDFRASIGTPVKAVLAGKVVAVNTKVASMCQYGKWVFIQHADGLSTLYAHLSALNVAKGEEVSTGEVIGYSGDTGYATGPHLHLGVYATAAVKFEQYTCHSGITLTIPIAANNGYLNALDYLPPYNP